LPPWQPSHHPGGCTRDHLGGRSRSWVIGLQFYARNLVVKGTGSKSGCNIKSLQRKIRASAGILPAFQENESGSGAHTDDRRCANTSSQHPQDRVATIGDRVMVAAQAGIHRGLRDDAIVGGSPAVDVRKYRRYSAALSRLPDLIRWVRALENRV